MIPCQGKKNPNKPAAVFAAVGIPACLAWDNGLGEDGEDPVGNRALLHLCGAEPRDYPQALYG